MRLKKKSCLHELLYTEMVKSGTVRLAAVEQLYPTKRFFFAPSGHIATLFPVWALYPEPRTRTRLYEIRIHLHCSLLRTLNCRLVKAYKTPNSCGEGLLGNLLGVRPIPTRYSLHALNPLLPGLKPGPAYSTLTELHCWC